MKKVIVVAAMWFGVFLFCLGYEVTHPSKPKPKQPEPDTVQLCDTLYTLTANRTSHLTPAEKEGVETCETLGFYRLPSQDNGRKPHSR
jgi:hypothetical protein